MAGRPPAAHVNPGILTEQRPWAGPLDGSPRLRKLDDDTQRMALRKLLILDAADALGDLRVPPGSRLEKLRGDRADTYSIRINRQWRICFRWTAAGPEDVEIVDYH